jgi:hypothetical protein
VEGDQIQSRFSRLRGYCALAEIDGKGAIIKMDECQGGKNEKAKI